MEIVVAGGRIELNPPAELIATLEDGARFTLLVKASVWDDDRQALRLTLEDGGTVMLSFQEIPLSVVSGRSDNPPSESCGT